MDRIITCAKSFKAMTFCRHPGTGPCPICETARLKAAIEEAFELLDDTTYKCGHGMNHATWMRRRDAWLIAQADPQWLNEKAEAAHS